MTQTTSRCVRSGKEREQGSQVTGRSQHGAARLPARQTSIANVLETEQSDLESRRPAEAETRMKLTGFRSVSEKGEGTLSETGGCSECSLTVD